MQGKELGSYWNKFQFLPKLWLLEEQRFSPFRIKFRIRNLLHFDQIVSINSLIENTQFMKLNRSYSDSNSHLE